MITGLVVLVALAIAASLLGRLLCSHPAAGGHPSSTPRGSATAPFHVPARSAGAVLEVLGNRTDVVDVVDLDGPLVIGSGTDCGLRLGGLEPLHARLTPLRDGEVRVDGLARHSGVYVDDQPVSMRSIAAPGDVVSLGVVRLRVAGPAAGASA